MQYGFSGICVCCFHSTCQSLIINIKRKCDLNLSVSVDFSSRLHSSCHAAACLHYCCQIQWIAIHKVLRTIDGLRHHREAVHLHFNGLVAICRAVQLLHIDIRACHVLHVDGLLAFGLYAVGQREVVGLHFGDIADTELLLQFIAEILDAELNGSLCWLILNFLAVRILGNEGNVAEDSIVLCMHNFRIRLIHSRDISVIKRTGSQLRDT